MREIKFRAWDKNTSRMYQVNHIDNLNNSKKICVWTNVIEGGYRFNPANLEQFTGLIDSGGTEIYEGDILKDVDDGTIIGSVECGNDGSWWCGVNLLFEVSDNQVCGNINKNPELIEEVE